ERGGGALTVPAMCVEDAQDALALVECEADGGTVPAGEQLGQLDAARVRQRAHVSRPGVLEEGPESAGVRQRERRPVRAVEAGDEVLDQEREVLTPLAERR